MRKALILTTALALAGCTKTGGVDWDQVGTVAGATVMVLGAVALGAAAGYAASQPTYYYAPAPVINCTSYGDVVVYTTCR